MLEEHLGGNASAKVLPNGSILSWSHDGALWLRDGQTGKLRTKLEGHKEQVNGADSISDGRILSWSQDATLRLWDQQSGELLNVLNGHTKSV